MQHQSSSHSSRSIRRLVASLALLAVLALSCRTVTGGGPNPTLPAAREATEEARQDATALPPRPVQPGSANPDEPVFITGEIPYSSPFFVNSVAEPFVMLEDEAGFVQRDEEYEFPLSSQAIGPVKLTDEQVLEFELALPAVPQGTQVDVDNDDQNETGVQVFVVAYWSNTWGGPFLEKRDGTGWSTAYTSARIDPESEGEIIGGTLVIWAPDDEQSFPSGFGDDGLLFTEDDPAQPVPAGYSLVNLDEEPFQVYKEARPNLVLNEGAGAVNDFSNLSYGEAFQALFDKVSREYPFTEEKGIDWQALYDNIAPQVDQANSPAEFYRVVREFVMAIPDGHATISFDPEIFYTEGGGSFGMVLTELGDGRVIIREVLPGGPAEKSGLQPGTEILTWGGEPVQQAIEAVVPYVLGTASTPHHHRLNQIIGLTRVPEGERITITYQNPGAAEPQETTLEAEIEVDSLLLALEGPSEDPLDLPIEGEVLDDDGIAYLRVNTFSADYNLMARLWETYMQQLVDNQVPALIIDMRTNSGGNLGLGRAFAGYLFGEEIPLYQNSYFSDATGKFEFDGEVERIEPAPFQYEGEIAVLVGPNCASACEGFAYALSQNDRAIIVGHYPTAGMFGEVGRGQYELPNDITLQFPTGRPESPEGELLIEGTGVVPDILVPVTLESALGQVDAVKEAAIEALQ